MKMTDDKIRAYILQALKDYSSIPSLSGKEHRMMAKVQEDFPLSFGDTYLVYKNDFPYYFARIPSNISSGSLIACVHLDRVPGPRYNAYIDTIVDKRDYVVGQLDDIIGIAILKYLVQVEQKSIPIVFTTQEERGNSYPQVIDVCTLHKLRPLSIDIDIFDDVEEKFLDTITLRYEDELAVFDETLVSSLHKTANKIDIPFSVSEGSAIVEPGFVARHTRGKIKGAHIGLPLLNYHTNMEEIRWKPILDAVKLVHSLF